MSFQLHEWDIHALSFGTGGARVTEVRWYGRTLPPRRPGNRKCRIRVHATPHLPRPARPAAVQPTRKLVLTKSFVGWETSRMIDVAVIADPAAAEAVLEPAGPGCWPN